MTKTKSQKLRAKQNKNNNNNGQSSNPNPRNQSKKKRSNNNRSVNLSGGKSDSKMEIMPSAFSRTMPHSSFHIRSGSKKDSVIIRGSDYIGNVATTAQNFNQGNAIRIDYLNPMSSSFEGTRLSQFANLYEKFVFRNIKVNYNPTVSTTSTGNIMLAFDKDYADTTPNANETGLRQYMSFQGSQGSNVWSMFSMSAKLTDMQDFYYCNDSNYDGRLVYQGQIYTVAASDLSASTTYGYLTIDYEIEFFDPQLENPSSYALLSKSGTNAISNSVAAAWNSFLPQAIISGVKPTRDQGGNQGLSLAQGTYIVEQLCKASSPSSVINQFSSIVNTLGFSPTVTNVLATGANAGAAQTRVDRIVVPQGGTNIFGSIGTASSFTDFGVKVTESYGAFLF